MIVALEVAATLDAVTVITINGSSKDSGHCRCRASTKGGLNTAAVTDINMQR